jgi:hypothetical protein
MCRILPDCRDFTVDKERGAEQEQGPAEVGSVDAGERPRTARASMFQDATHQFQAGLVRAALEECGWNVKKAAARLGLARSHVYNLIRLFGIVRDRSAQPSSAVDAGPGDASVAESTLRARTTDAAEIRRRAAAIRDRYGIEGTHVFTTHVREELEGGTVWEGDVDVFHLHRHRSARIACAWSHDGGEGSRCYAAVLLEGSVTSARDAVRAHLAAAHGHATRE